MKNVMAMCSALGLVLAATGTYAQVPLSGYFIARAECPAYQSFRRETNPGNVMTRVDHAYDLIGKNNDIASHYLIKMDAEPNSRWVATSCGEHVVPVAENTAASPIPRVSPSPVSSPSSSPATSPSPSPIVDGHGGQTDGAQYLLAVSWQPGFCESHATKPECRSQTEMRFDASHFTLHGLWPQPRGKEYCGVAANVAAADRDSRWADLPELSLAAETRQELDTVMPGTQSFLHRHEWTKHGTCYPGATADKYYRDALKLMQQLNRPDSAFRTLFADNIGKPVTSTQIRSAFDKAFGAGASNKIKVACNRDGNRTLITEITIGLQGVLDDVSLGDAIAAAPNANNIGCTQGIVDPVGLQ